MDKAKTNKPRANRYKKTGKRQRRDNNGRGLMNRLVLFMKLGGLMTVLLTLSVFFILAYTAVTRSDYFKIESIVVEGLSRLSRQSVIAQAGLEPGQNLLAVNLHLVYKRLLNHSWIADAQVSREIPDTLRVHIKEHQPLAVVVVDIGRRFLLNTQGRIFMSLGDEDMPDLPVIKGIDFNDLSWGKNDLSPVMQTVMQGLVLGRNHPSIFGRDHIGCLKYDYELGVTLISRKHQRAYQLGFEPFEVKFNRLARLVPRLSENKRWRQYQTVDVNNPDRIVVQLGSTPITRGDT